MPHTFPMPCEAVFSDGRARALWRPQLPCLFRRARAYWGGSQQQEASSAVLVESVRVGVRMFPWGQSLALLPDMRECLPVILPGQDLELELRFAAGVLVGEHTRRLQLVAFCERFEQRSGDELRASVKSMLNSARDTSIRNMELRAELEQVRGQFEIARRERGELEVQIASERQLVGQLELKIVALRAELEQRAAWRRELAERRAHARSAVRAPVVSVLVDLDVD